MDRKEIFKDELNYIANEDIKESLITMIEMIPDYFFHIPASSTGKYHPLYATEDGGLLRHTKAVVRMAQNYLVFISFLKEQKI